MEEGVNKTEQFQELSLGEILKVIIDYFNEVRNHWYIVVLFIIPPLAYFVYDAYTDIPKYSANSTFMLNDDEDTAITGIGDLLGGLVGRGKKSKGSLSKVLQLFESRRIVESTLFKTTEIKGKEDLFANHIIRLYGFHEILEESNKGGALLKLDSFYFSHSNLDSFDLNEKRLVAILYKKVAGDAAAGLSPMIASNMDEESGIMKMSVTTYSEDLTINMLETFYEQLSKYYVDKAVEKQKKIFDILTAKRDSVGTSLTYAEFQLADFEDTHRNLVTVKGELKRTKLRRQKLLLEAMYIEVIRNLEKADFALRRRTPYVQIIDPPQTPIFPSKKSLFMGIIIGIVLGAGIGIMFLLIRKLIRDALQREKNKKD